MFIAGVYLLAPIGCNKQIEGSIFNLGTLINHCRCDMSTEGRAKCRGFPAFDPDCDVASESNTSIRGQPCRAPVRLTGTNFGTITCRRTKPRKLGKGRQGSVPATVNNTESKVMIGFRPKKKPGRGCRRPPGEGAAEVRGLQPGALRLGHPPGADRRGRPTPFTPNGQKLMSTPSKKH